MKVLRNLVIAALFAGLAGCTVWPIGQDPYGMDQRRAANTVIDALQTYRRDKGTFPGNLDMLVPAYLPAIPSFTALKYEPYDGSIGYHYIPSWPQLRTVWCNSVGNTTNWRCEEHLL